MNTELFNTLKEQVILKLRLEPQIEDEQVLKVIDYIIGESILKDQPVKRKLLYRKQLFQSLRQLDVLQDYLEDEEVTEIMVNGYNQIFLERYGKIEKADKGFESEEKLNDVIQRIVAKANRVINDANPIVDARLEDGSRVNAVLSPVSLDGSTLTIRKFGKHSMTMQKLIQLHSVTTEVSQFLEQLVIAKYNIFISGGTGSGKTTFLNALSNFIPEDERIITIEDSAELQIKRIRNLVRLEMRNENVEGKRAISIRQLIKNSLRMRPDRIIVGEVRDDAAIDMLQALNTGHDGSLSTGHANSPADMLDRLETLVLLGSDIPLMAARKQIASAIDIIIHLGRLRDKSRKVLEITEVIGMQDDNIILQPLFLFEEKGENKEGKVIGELVRTEHSLYHQGKLNRAGVKI